MEDKVYIAGLLDAYRSLLTEKQSDILSLYYEEDLSLSEITDHYSITRQAVLDVIKRGIAQLKHYEEKLMLSQKRSRRMEAVSEIKSIAEEIEDFKLSEKITNIISKLED